MDPLLINMLNTLEVISISPPRVYLLDTNAFIQPAKQYYQFDIFPSFWKSLCFHAEKGRIISIDKVRDEIEKGKDDVDEWARREFSNWFMSSDEQCVADVYGQLMKWANKEEGYPPHTYPDHAVKEFMKGTNADARLIAYAKAKGCVLVTQELPKRSEKSKDQKKIKIPDACKESGLNVECINLFQMLKELGERF